MSYKIDATHLSPVKCDKCGAYEYIKLGGNNSLVVFTCQQCRVGHP